MEKTNKEFTDKVEQWWNGLSDSQKRDYESQTFTTSFFEDSTLVYKDIETMYKKAFGVKEPKQFYIQMASPESDKQCDVYPHNSIQLVVETDDGGLKSVKRNQHFIPRTYPVVLLNTLPEIKMCTGCSNDFPIEDDFINVDGVEKCIRCYEREYLPNRDAYRTILRKVFLKDSQPK